MMQEILSYFDGSEILCKMAVLNKRMRNLCEVSEAVASFRRIHLKD